jgi:ABC-type multidrug transport system ATPase subunit
MIKLLRYFRLKGIEQVQAQYLSAAQKKKVSLAIAMIGFPKVLALDEVTSSVDHDGKKRILSLIKAYTDELNNSVLIATHNADEADEYCDRVTILKDGVLCKAGSLRGLRE